MKELTGYDPRVFQDAVLYWVGLVGLGKEELIGTDPATHYNG
jgi:hypothetical protein